MQKIYLIQDENMKKANIETFIDKWNKLNENKEPYSVFKDTSEHSIQGVSIWLVNYPVDEGLINRIREGLTETPNLNVCFFLEPKEMVWIEEIEHLREEYPFSNIGTVLKPTQFSRVDTFLKSTQTKKDMVTFDADWDDIDIDFGQLPGTKVPGL